MDYIKRFVLMHINQACACYMRDSNVKLYNIPLPKPEEPKRLEQRANLPNLTGQ